MKKLLLPIIAGAMITTASPVMNPQAEAATYSMTSAVSPALTTSDISAMKKGTYAFKGVRLGTTFGSVQKLWGVSGSENVYRDADGTMVDWWYGKHDDITLSGYHSKRSASVSGTKVSTIDFTYDTKLPQLTSTLSKALGKPTYSETTEPGWISREYGRYISVELVKENNKWYVFELTYGKHD